MGCFEIKKVGTSNKLSCPAPRLEFEFRGGLKWITGKIVQKKGKNGK
jgi:hypothetical protein